MKKILLTLVALALLIPSLSWSAACTVGTLTETPIANTDKVRIVQVDILADGSGDVSGTANCDVTIDGFMYMVVYIPDTGGTQPAATTDIDINDFAGKGIMNTDDASNQLENLAQTNQQFMPRVGASVSRYVWGDATILADEMGASNGATIYFYIWKEKLELSRD